MTQPSPKSSDGATAPARGDRASDAGDPASDAPAAAAGTAVATLEAEPEPVRDTPPAADASTLTPRVTPISAREHHVFRSRRSGAPKLREYLVELWDRREFVVELARCTLRAQNYLNAFGQLWLVLNPLLLGCVYFMLVDIINDSAHASNYFTMLLGGLFLYNYFSGILSQSAGSIIGSSRLVLNSRLPRLVLPITQIGIAFMRFLPSMIVFLAAHTIQSVPWGMAAFYAIPAFLEMTLFAAGLGFIFATLQVYFRDVANILPYMTRIWLFLSPVLFQLGPEVAKHGLKSEVISLNPLSPIIGSWGNALVYNTAPPTSWLLQGAAWSVASFVIGVLVFTRREREFSVRL